MVRAIDDDGTSPNNQIRYSLSPQQSSERATMYFGIDDKTGEVEVLADLKRELYENYLLNVIATDLGEPNSLSTSVTLVIQVRILYYYILISRLCKSFARNLVINLFDIL